MPIYEIACKECGNQYERIVSFSSTDLPACPACRSADVTRLLSKPAIHFKGSGWYITDSKEEDKKKAAAEKADSNGSGPKKAKESESKSEAKSEAKNETKAEAETSSTSEKSPAKDG